MDYYERPRIKITKKGAELLAIANDSIRSIVDDLVISSVLLGTIKPRMTLGGNKPPGLRIGEQTQTIIDTLEDSLFTLESLAALDDNAEGLLLLLYPDSVKESLTKAIPFLVEAIAEMKETIERYNKLIEEAEPESGEGYVESYIAMLLEDKIKNFEEAIVSIKKALDIFI